jgi:hypothetical protein
MAAVSRTDRVTACCTLSPLSSPAGASDVRPRLTLSPTSPQALAGMRIDPPPSEAWAAGTSPAATAAAAPPEEPPGDRLGSQGLRVGPWASGSVVGSSPNSGVFVRPTRTKPARRHRATSSVSAGATYPASRTAVLPLCSGSPALAA